MRKSDVNGDNTNEVYKYLKSQKSGFLGLTRIKWNFEVSQQPLPLPSRAPLFTHFEQKFLIDKQGKVVERYATTTKVEAIEPTIEKLLSGGPVPGPATSSDTHGKSSDSPSL
jgi:glutathione peroxidase